MIKFQIFLLITNLLSEFNFTLPDGDKGDIGTQTKVFKIVEIKNKVICY